VSAPQRPVAVVTGAASGIGRATAIRLACDYDLALVDVDLDGLTDTCTQIAKDGGAAQTFRVDLRDPHAVGAVTREIAVTFGPPDVLVNVAGIGIAATVLETSDEDWDRVLVHVMPPSRVSAGPPTRNGDGT